MKSSKLYTAMQWLILVLLVSTVCAALFSWIGSTLGFPIRNLLSSEGVHWILRTALSNFAVTPVLSFLLLMMGGGVLRSSGLDESCRKIMTCRFGTLTIRQHLALRLSLLTLLGYILLIVWGILSPGGILLSVTGNLEGSPLLDGLVIWVTLGVVIVSSVFGCITGRFQSWKEWVSALINGVSWGSPAIVCLFLGGQLWACLKFIWG